MMRGIESVQAGETRYETEAGNRLRNAPSVGYMRRELGSLERRESEEYPAQPT